VAVILLGQKIFPGSAGTNQLAPHYNGVEQVTPQPPNLFDIAARSSDRLA
jgi:hypothetical protein